MPFGFRHMPRLIGAQPRFNGSDKDSDVTLSNSDLTMTLTANQAGGVRSTTALSSGKWYVEWTFSGAGGIGFATSAAAINTYPGGSSTSWGIYTPNGDLYNNGSGSSYGSAPATSLVRLALDLENNRAFWGDSNGWFASGDPAAGTNAGVTGLTGTYYLMAGSSSSAGTKTRSLVHVASYSFAPPAGFLIGWGN